LPISWTEKKTTYALEGSIFIAGAVVQWLRDGWGLSPRRRTPIRWLKRQIRPLNFYLVPALYRLGAPWLMLEARGAIYGLTRNAGPAEFARAALESVGFQTRDLLEAMHADWPARDGAAEAILRVDGGTFASDWAMQSRRHHRSV
jgi:glycerol kinase